MSHKAHLKKFVPLGFANGKDVLIRKVSTEIQVVLIVLGIAGVLVNVILLGWLNANRTKFTQLVFLQLVLVGGALLFLLVAISGLQPSAFVCKTQLWLGHIGFILLFLPLFLKLYRVAVFFQNNTI
jgi:hypothetical protein